MRAGGRLALPGGGRLGRKPMRIARSSRGSPDTAFNFGASPVNSKVVHRDEGGAVDVDQHYFARRGYPTVARKVL